MGRQAEVDIDKKSTQTVNVSADGRHFRLNALMKVVTDSFVAPVSVF